MEAETVARANTYPLSIRGWELKHGISRQERCGMVYVSVTDFSGMCDMLR